MFRLYCSWSLVSANAARNTCSNRLTVFNTARLVYTEALNRPRGSPALLTLPPCFSLYLRCSRHFSLQYFLRHPYLLHHLSLPFLCLDLKKCSCILSVYLKKEIWDRVCQGFNTQSVKHNTNPQVMWVGNGGRGGAQMDLCKVIYASLMYGRQNQLKLLYFLHQGFKKTPSSLLEESLQQCHAMFLFLFGLFF